MTLHSIVLDCMYCHCINDSNFLANLGMTPSHEPHNEDNVIIHHQCYRGHVQHSVQGELEIVG